MFEITYWGRPGPEKLTGRVWEQFYLLVDYWYRQRLPVLASSNSHKEAFAQRLDRRVMDRCAR